MNVIIDNVIFSLQESGGISVYWYHLVKRLIAEPQYKVSYIEGKNADANIFNQQISYGECTLIETNTVPVVGRYLNLELPKFHQLSIFHSSYYRISKNPKHINITTIHDFTYEHFNSGLKLFVHSNQKKKAILNSDGIICISENTKRDLLNFIPETANMNIRVIHNGVSEDFKKVPIREYNDFDIDFHAFSYILYVGDRSARYKNFELAVVASKLAHKPLVIVGGGALTENELVLLNTELGDLSYRHYDNLATEKLNTLYNFAHCLLYPSKYEGFGIPPLEAQKAECPVVAFKASSVPEVVGEGGLLVEESTAEAFAMAVSSLENETFRMQLIEKGTNNVKSFSWQRTFVETINFYDEMLSQKMSSE